MRKISVSADGKWVRYIFEDNAGDLAVKHCPYDEENDLRFVNASSSDGGASNIKLTEVRDVVLRVKDRP
jgi:hypothetical protein